LKRVTSVWLVALALLLRMVAPSDLHATTALAGSPTPLSTATGTIHLTYSYDAANRRTGLTQPGSSPNTYTVTHNGAGDLTTLSAPNGGEQTWRYDDAGRITGTTWISGTAAR
jgi:YD repeat-containing protein